MGKLVGIHKELDDDEKLLQESSELCEIYSKGGYHSFSQLEEPDITFAKAFLTNKRLLLLSLFAGNLDKMRDSKGDIRGVTGNWLEIPLTSILKVETPAKITFSDVLSTWKIFGGKELPKRKGELTLYLRSMHEKKSWWSGSKDNITSIVIENRDIWATSLKSAMHDHKMERAKNSIDSPFDEYGNRICSLCGTHYEQDKVKMVQCPDCKRFICRQKKVGILGGWEDTDCFIDDDGLCKTCSKKMKTQKASIKPEEKKCSSCGAKVRGKFCSKCGGRA